MGKLSLRAGETAILPAMGRHQIKPQLAETRGVLSDHANWKLLTQHFCLPPFSPTPSSLLFPLPLPLFLFLLFSSYELIWEKYLEWEGGKIEIVRTRRKRLHFQVRVEDVACLGTKPTKSPFSTQSRHRGYSDASFVAPLLGPL